MALTAMNELYHLFKFEMREADSKRNPLQEEKIAETLTNAIKLFCGWQAVCAAALGRKRRSNKPRLFTALGLIFVILSARN